MHGYRYLRYKSGTWWISVLCILFGIAQMYRPELQDIELMRVLFKSLTGNGSTSPGEWIAFGVVSIGLRDAILRRE